METDGFVLVKPSRKRRIKSKKCSVLPDHSNDNEMENIVDLGGVIQQVAVEGKLCLNYEAETSYCSL